ncbi:MAG: asparagine synthase (glutamine-hydrolyzing) [Chloroflexi bacterium]|nr:MAG: asparagine synthase (glutamine-hydrolyzing) [Chloroflexota bacterium]
MCGVCGIYEMAGQGVDRTLLRRMAAAIAHRGPDGEGFHVDGAIGLGHRRLSIIDLEGGAQPISNEDGTIQVVFNGEIYNFVELRKELEDRGHRFKTRSDTEVIVHGYEEWGTACVTRFNGMFAFALWDSRRAQLFLARDHLGIKPLYYTRIGTRFAFASEIKALLADPACPRAVSLSSLSQLFTVRFVPSPATMFEGIHKLPPGHSMLVDRDGPRVERYWTWKPRVRRPERESELIEEYQSLVADAVRLQMRSDVPVGLFLSSGVDSGALLAMMRDHSQGPVRTFTIGFQDGEGSNETDDARALAARFGADHDEMIVGPADYQRYFDRYLLDLEEPVGNETAAAFYFVSLIARRKVKVALTGQGADEPWAGYHRYIGLQLSQLYSRLPASLTNGLLRPLVERYARHPRLQRGVVALSERDLLARMVKIYSFFSMDMKTQLFLPWVKAQAHPDGREAKDAIGRLQRDVEQLDPLSQMLYIDTRASLPDDLLMVGDKTAMANSLEARVPYLDFRLVEFVESLPPRFKLSGLQGKYLHKKALRKWLPKEVVNRRKKGFDNPIDRWLRAHLKHYVNDSLLSRGAAVGRYFDRSYIQQLVAEHESGRRNYLRQLYLLISFELWHKQFIGS